VQSFWVFDFCNSVSFRVSCNVSSDCWGSFSGEGLVRGGWEAGGWEERFQRLMLSA
jgi:hypothetical protein